MIALGLFEREPQKHLTFSGVDTQENFRGNFPIEAALRSFGYHPEIDLSNGLKLTAKALGLL